MSLLALLAATTPVDPGPDPDPEPPVDTTPYPMPTAPPWNVPTYAITPTPDGSGSEVHPDVVDMALHHPSGTWHGWRYWMAVTPYLNANAFKENPVVLTSHDGFTWQHPTGAPVAYLYTGLHGGAQSDTDLVYDPTGDRLLMTWREYTFGASSDFEEFIYGATSPDGVTWSTPRVTLWQDADPEDNRADNTVSQSLVRMTDTDWRAWTRSQGAVLHLRTATDPLGTWSAPTVCTLTGARTTGLWHLDVIRHDGLFLGLFNFQWELRPAVSVDGLAWEVGDAFLTHRAGEWDSRTMYRSTMQPHEDGQTMRVWYSTDSTEPSSWRVGYTHVPLALWDL